MQEEFLRTVYTMFFCHENGRVVTWHENSRVVTNIIPTPIMPSLSTRGTACEWCPSHKNLVIQPV